MRYVARHGYPAPRVEDVRANGSELVMERIDGPTMLEVLSKRPWTLRRNAGRLAMLHHRPTRFQLRTGWSGSSAAVTA